MSVTKLDAEDNTPIAGAVFGLYADEDIKNVDGKVIIEKGTLLEKATSDENGKIEQIVLGAEDMKGVDFAPISEGQLPSPLKENGGKAR